MRIRSVHPRFWRSLTLAELSRDERLFFIGLWSAADDVGRGVADPRLLKGELFPLDDDVHAGVLSLWLQHLAGLALIVLYDDPRGRPLYAIRSWAEYQRPQKPTPSQLTPPPADSVSYTGILPDQSPTPPVGLRPGVGVGVGKGVGVGTGRVAAAAAAPAREQDPGRETTLLTHFAPADREAVHGFLDRGPERGAWVARLAGYLEGLDFPGGQAATPAAIATACRDLTDVAAVNPARFRRYVERAMVDAAHPVGATRAAGGASDEYDRAAKAVMAKRAARA